MNKSATDKNAAPDIFEEEIQVSMNRTNLARGRLVAKLLLVIEVVILALTVAIHRDGLWAVPGPYYMMMYLTMILMMSGFSFWFAHLEKDIPHRAKGIRIAGILFSSIILGWSGGISLLDQTYSDGIIVYCLALVTVAVVPFFRPWEMFFIYFLVHCAFLTLLIFLPNQVFPFGNVVNSTTFIVICWVISLMRYQSHLALLISQLEVQEKNRELERLNRELQQVNQRLERLSKTDGLTGLLNRSAFDRTLRTEWDRCKKLGMPLSLIMVDIDLYKAYNDYYGHQHGDTCIRKVTNVLAQSAGRAFNAAARYGGEEFAVILPRMASEEAAELAELMRKRVQALAIPHAASSVSAYVTISLGVCSSSLTDGLTLESFIRRSDIALYKAKERRNQVALYRDEDTDPTYFP